MAVKTRASKKLFMGYDMMSPFRSPPHAMKVDLFLDKMEKKCKKCSACPEKPFLYKKNFCIVTPV